MSLRNAINQMCKFCIHDCYQKGTWRTQVKNCTSKNCPLYPVRPMPRQQTIAQSEIVDSSSEMGPKWCQNEPNLIEVASHD